LLTEKEAMDSIVLSTYDACCTIQLLCHMLSPQRCPLQLSAYKPLSLLDQGYKSEQASGGQSFLRQEYLFGGGAPGTFSMGRWISKLSSSIDFQVHLVLATVPGDPAAVQVWNRTGSSNLGCLPDSRGTQWVRGRTGTGLRFHFPVPSTLAPIKYSSFDRIMTLSIRKLFSFGRSFTSCIQICNPTDIHWMVVKYWLNSAKLAGFRLRLNEYVSDRKSESGRWMSD
jgi:hypothetical protein